MASTALKGMRNKGAAGLQACGNGSGDIMSQFLKFKSDVEASGENPQTILNKLLANGKVTPAMLNKAKTLAAVFVNKFKSGR
jgi:ankyrin repeat protein